jgi:2-polyprenyl-6-methoxyphenol hydroxylase-like FAD-dependent oxidoreductase
MSEISPILICGAGPTGLVLALWLAKRKTPFRIIDKAPHAGTASRALVVQPRTLEFYHQLGIDDRFTDEQRKFTQLRFWVKQKQVGMARFSGGVADISPYPFFTIFPQDEHEALLEEELAKQGIQVERTTELINFEEATNGIDVKIKKPNGEEETFHASYLAGCDGARSAVREVLKAGFPGGTYEHIFYVADVLAAGPVINSDLDLALDDSDFLAVFPLKGEGRARLIGTVEADTSEDRQFKWEDVSHDILRRMQIDIKTINWFSTYKVHHRVAAFFRKGHAFLLGDAAHVHSPVGGQGMNTGIGDAINLAWKLDAVIKNKAPETILDTYEPERIRFARSLVKTTDRIFEFVNKQSTLANFIRTRITPVIVPAVFRNRALRRILFRLISQTRINYRHSTLSAGKVKALHSGDRLPWLQAQDNFKPLISLDWQVHFYGAPPKEVKAWCESTGIPLHVFSPGGHIPPDTLCLLRPDGHLGWIGRSTDLPGIALYANQWLKKAIFRT